MAKSPERNDSYSEEETQHRVEATLKGAFNTPRPKKASARSEKPKKKPGK